MDIQMLDHRYPQQQQQQPRPPIRTLPTSRLELLPRELRDRIYGFLFPGALKLTISTRPLDPPISRTSRLLRAESLPVLYNRVTLHFERRVGQRATWTVASWLAVHNAAARLALTRELVLIIDEESGYSGDPLPRRSYAGSLWSKALPELSEFFGDRLPLRKLVICVKGKKKCHAQFEGAGSDSVPNVGDWCDFADTAPFYAGFAADLTKRRMAQLIEMQGIFPLSWVVGCRSEGWVVKRNFEGYLAECALYKIWADDEMKKRLAVVVKQYEEFQRVQPTTEWEFRLRDVHAILEVCWRNKIVQSYHDRDVSYDSRWV